MRGHIQQRGKNTYRVFISLGWNEEKKRYDKTSFTVHGTKREAEQALAQKLASLGRGPVPQSGQMTVGEYLEYWIVEHVSTLRPKTQKWYKQIIRNHIMKSPLARIRLSKLNPLDIQRYLRQLKLLDSDGNPTKSPPSPNTVHAHYRTLHSAFKKAVDWNILDYNPIEKVQPPRQTKRRGSALTPSQAAKFLEEAEARNCYPLYLTMIVQGLRVGEVLALKQDDLDFNKGTMVIDEKLERGGLNPLFGPVKTEKGDRILKMGRHLSAVLEAHMAELEELKKSFGSSWNCHGLIFPTANGTAISPRNLHRQFKQILRAVGLPETLRPHDLRHTSATLLIMEGVPIKTISNRLGHSGTGITQDLYGHVLQEMEEEAAEVIDDIFSPKNEEPKKVLVIRQRRPKRKRHLRALP